ncbi:MAG: polyprenyl synthetase family protein [Bdellovibrionales bacterium]|nr:polyprenyl synthetase family protein [Bdellovibrionales bacterium]
MNTLAFKYSPSFSSGDQQAVWREGIERALSDALDRTATEGTLKKAIHYAVFPGGKRVRPLLALTLASDFGVGADSYLPASVALELLHCASLVHDDLPALDDDQERRGRPSCHVAFNDATAILAGDLLIAAAFEQISSAGLDSGKTSALHKVAATAFVGVCRGQQLDIEQSCGPDELVHVHRLKTGALFAATFHFGAIFADLNSAQCRLASQVGENFGITFQMIDDYIDCYGTSEQRGRGSSSDNRNNKITYFTAAGMKGVGEGVGPEPLEHGRSAIADSLLKLEKSISMFELTCDAANNSGFELLSTRSFLERFMPKFE